jgi:hypothetical protein
VPAAARGDRHGESEGADRMEGVERFMREGSIAIVLGRSFRDVDQYVAEPGQRSGCGGGFDHP